MSLQQHVSMGFDDAREGKNTIQVEVVQRGCCSAGASDLKTGERSRVARFCDATAKKLDTHLHESGRNPNM